MKRAVDLLLSSIGLVITSPILLLVAAAVRLADRGPALFRQERMGRNLVPFHMLKFRTMVVGAEQHGPGVTARGDARVTPVGRWLRDSKLDELPQLFNVLRGEMSLVGPRPLPVNEVKRFNDLAQRRRLSVKPGLTCLWQVSGRNKISDFKEWVRLDLEYIDNWSIWLDLAILIRTVPAVFRGTGAK